MQTLKSKMPARTSFVDEVYKVLLDAICDGTLPPGTRITQEEIAEQLDVSRSPVLQALRLLKKDGFIQDAPGRGVQITPLEAGWIDSLYEVRGALDALAAKLAAQKKAQIDPALLQAGVKATQSGDMQAIIDADLAFHNAIYRASGNPLIEASALTHWAHLRRVMGAVHQVSATRSTLWDEHAAIAAAIGAGDVAQAVALSENHIGCAMDGLGKNLSLLLAAHDEASTEVSRPRPRVSASRA
jgi:DNA-binding GntR family transcriptional regulator